MMGNRLRPLYDALNQYVLQAGKVHTDDVRDDRNAGATEPPAVWFSYSADRKGEHPLRHLSGYRGVLQADAYGAYDALYESAYQRSGVHGACQAKNP